MSILEFLIAVGFLVWAVGLVGSFVDFLAGWWFPCMAGGVLFMYAMIFVLLMSQPS